MGSMSTNNTNLPPVRHTSFAGYWPGDGAKPNTSGLRKGRTVRRGERAAYDALHRMMLDGRIGAWSIVSADQWVIVEDRDGPWPVPDSWPTLTLAEVHEFLAARGLDEFASAPRLHVGAATKAAATKRRHSAMEDLLRRTVDHLPADLAAEAAAILDGATLTEAA